jgi:DNA-binding beta-propeller fold protein YncE
MTWLTKSRFLTGLTIVLPVVVLAGASGLLAQTPTLEFSLPGVSGLNRPTGLAVSATGERIALSDASTNRIAVIDFQGELLWTAGSLVNLQHPGALCFLGERDILLVPNDLKMICLVTEDDPARLDTVAVLDSLFEDKTTFDQILPLSAPAGGYLVLDKGRSRIWRFDAAWQPEDEPLIEKGSGLGKLRRPEGMALLDGGRIAVVDRENLPLQIFSAEGKPLVSSNWSSPEQERGWQAVAVAVDSRGIIWAADQTNRQIRLFDRTGVQTAQFEYSVGMIAPVAMAGIAANRVLIVDETGRFYVYAV